MVETYDNAFTEGHSTERIGKYTTIFIMRRACSNVIFRTDGSKLNTAMVQAGKERKEKFRRVQISKRKGIAPERREGRATLRSVNMLEKCKINEEPCGKCIDCNVYGMAVGDKVAPIKSSVISDEGLSILPITQIQNKRTFNQTFQNGTMVDSKGKQGQGIQSNYTVKPESLFLDIETLDSVSKDEFMYVMNNIINTKRYGAMVSRLGKMENIIVAVAFSDMELFSNLEWVQETYDCICEKLDVGEGELPAFPINLDIAQECALKTLQKMVGLSVGNVTLVQGSDLNELITSIGEIYSNENTKKASLERIQSTL